MQVKLYQNSLPVSSSPANDEAYSGGKQTGAQAAHDIANRQ